jgi:subfamily B ATP-binding cassette protein MsbA
LFPLLSAYAWRLPAVILLGILSTLAESIGLSLFVPLLQNLDQRSYPAAEPDGLQAFFHFVLSRLPADHALAYIAALILLLTAGKALLTYGYSVMVANIISRVTHSLRSQIFSRAIGISQQSLDENGSGRLINILATDTWHASDAISTLIGLAINLCSIFVFSALLLALSWKLTVTVALGVAVVSLLLRILTRGAHRLGREGVEANAVLSNHMLDALEGIREIQMFSLAEYLRKRFDRISETVRSIYFRLDLMHRAVSPLSEVLYIGLLIALLLLGVKTGNSAPTLIVFLLVLYRLQPQVRQVDAARLSLVALTPAIEEVIDFLSPLPETNGRKASVAIPFERSIEFDRVGFSYGGDLVLKDISFSIPFGQTTAIVGPSGSGKTTLVSLLSLFYEPSLGEIRVDGNPLSQLDVDEWRRQIAWVSQDAYIFSASIAENIRYGRLDATDDEVLSAAAMADADPFISQLPQGYQTPIGNGGSCLSNGQIQRIALARAFVRRPRILILDEATNALDSLSEESIRDGLRRMDGERAVIIISHRISTVRHADQVIVLSNGRVAELGSPSYLLSNRGLLHKLRELQHVE